MRQRTPILTLPEGKSQGPALPGFEHLTAARRERKQAEAQAIEDARAFLGTPGPAARLPQSIFHFDRGDQVAALVAAREDAPDVGFMARLLALCALPRTNPGKRLQYTRVNGPYELVMSCTGRARLPYGILPRLLLAWVCSEAVRTQSRVLTLGASLAAFMRKLGMENRSGGVRGDTTRLRHQMDRLFNASIVLTYTGPGEAMRMGSLVTDQMHLWWDERRPDTPVMWESTIELGEKFFNEIIRNPIPIDLHTLKALKRSALGVDLYLWLVYRTFSLKAPLRLSWKALYQQFGAEQVGGDQLAVWNFRRQCIRELGKIRTAWPEFTFGLPYGALVIHPTTPRILPGRDGYRVNPGSLRRAGGARGTARGPLRP